MAPIVNGLKEKYGEKVNFVHLDIDDPENRELIRKLGVGWPPVFYLLDGQGNILDRRYLYKEASELEAVFEKYLQP